MVLYVQATPSIDILGYNKMHPNNDHNEETLVHQGYLVATHILQHRKL
jgi:hypothetical protein